LARALHELRVAPAFAFADPSVVPEGTALSALHAAALDYTDHITRNVSVPAPVFARLRTQIIDAAGNGDKDTDMINRQLLDITATVSGYNFTTRILRALDVAGMADSEVPVVHDVA